MNKLKVAALVAMMVSGAAMAETDKTGFYVGGALNQVKASGDGDGSTDGVGFGAYGGYNFVTTWSMLQAKFCLPVAIWVKMAWTSAPVP